MDQEGCYGSSNPVIHISSRGIFEDGNEELHHLLMMLSIFDDATCLMMLCSILLESHGEL